MSRILIKSTAEGKLVVHKPKSCEHEWGKTHVRHGDDTPLEKAQLCCKCGRIRFHKLSKAMPLKSGQRWITVHPNGDEETGIPVLIQEHPDGTASVVAGAGGKLNYLKLTRLRSKEDWKESAQHLKEVKKKREEARLSEMSEEDRKKESAYKEEIKQKKTIRDAEFVSAVMEAHGIKPEAWKLDKDVLEAMPVKSRNLAEKQHLRKMVKEAKRLVGEARKDILAAHDQVVQEVCADLPAEAILAPASAGTAGNGYVAAVNRKAEENGLTASTQAAEAKDISWRHFLDAANGDTAEAGLRRENVERLHAALAEVRAPVIAARRMGLLDKELRPQQPSVRDVAKVLMAERAYRDFERKYESVSQEVRESGVPKAAFLDAQDEDISEEALREMQKRYDLDANADPEAVKQALAEELDQDMMRMSAERLLDYSDQEVADSTKALKQHIGVGHFQALNTAALGVTDEPLFLDRVTADILGPEASAQVLAAQWRNKLELRNFDILKNALAQHHIRTQREVADVAIESYEEIKREISQMKLPAITDTDSLMTAQLINEQRANLINVARQSLGVALGKLEGEAALVKAMMEKTPSTLNIPLGAVSNAQAVAQAHVLGLTKGVRADEEPADAEYRIDSDGVNKFLTVLGPGMEKLRAEPDPEYVAKARNALAIKRGDWDEDGWLPEGIEAHPATAFTDPQVRSLALTRPLGIQADMSRREVERAVEDYIGAQLADGQDPESLRRDLWSMEFRKDSVPDKMERHYIDALNNLGFGTYDQTKALSQEQLDQRAQQIVDKRAEEIGGDAHIVALNKQRVPIGEQLYMAIHSALSAAPQAKIAFAGSADLTAQDKGAIRDYFWHQLTEEKQPSGAETRAERLAEEKAIAEKPKAYQVNIFGGSDEVQQSQHHQATKEQEHAWDRYIKAMGSTDAAYRSIQEVMRGQLMERIGKELTALTGTEYKTGTKRLSNWDRHVIGLVSPERQAQILGDRGLAEKKRQAQVASRVAGKFAKEDAAGARRERAEALLRASEAKQIALFRTGKSPSAERVTLGDVAENQIRSVFGNVAANFDPKRPVDIPKDVSMSGGGVRRQRAIKLLEANKRLSLNLGVGSGKTVIALGSFSHLHSKGKVKRAIMAVPSVVQGAFGSEALRFMTPGKYRWFANPAATAEQRRAAYSDRSKHMVIVTHQALRDDLTQLLADHKFRGDVDETHKWLENSTEEERTYAVKQAMRDNGWDFDMSVVDEGHDLLGRAGKKDSRMARTIDALTFNTPYYMSMTADPIKNDACVHPNTIVADPVRGISMSIKKWAERQMAPWVWAVDDDGAAHLIHASVPFVKSRQPMYRVVLESGQQVTVAATHRFLTPEGWKPLSLLSVGCRIAAVSEGLSEQPQVVSASPPDTQDRSSASGPPPPASLASRRFGSCPDLSPLGAGGLPGMPISSVSPRQSFDDAPRRTFGHVDPASDALHDSYGAGSMDTGPGSQGRCSTYCHPCDELPLHESDIDRESSPSPSGVPGHCLEHLRVGDLGNGPIHSRRGPRIDLPCTEDVQSPYGNQIANPACDCARYSASGRTGERPRVAHEADRLFAAVSSLAEPIAQSPSCAVQGYHRSTSQRETDSQSDLCDNSASESYSCIPVTELSDQRTNRQRRVVVRRHPEWLSIGIPGLDAGSRGCPEPDSIAGPSPRTCRLPQQSSSVTTLPLPNCESEHHTERVCLPYQCISSAVLYSRIIVIDKLSADDVYDMTVPVFHNYLAQGIWHHNSEAFSLLHKIDPKRYNDPEAFHAKYGVNAPAAREALQHELMPYSYTGQIRPDVTAMRGVREHELTPEQSTLYSEVNRNYRVASRLLNRGQTDSAEYLEAVRAISPHTFRGKSEDRQREIAKRLGGFLASARDGALDRIVNLGHHDKDVRSGTCAKMDAAVNYVVSKRTSGGKQAPGIVFAHSLEAVHRLADELKKRGIKVAAMTGSDSSADKEKIRLKFQPGSAGARPDADVLICSDAGAVGQNLQRAQFVAQFDTPHTAKTYEQRIGRMERIGQTNPDIEAVDFVSRTQYESRRRKRLSDKQELREIFTAPTEMLDDTGLAHDIWVERQNQLQRDSGALAA